ncbi:Rv1733c family protein [Nocardia brasiliensis]|uniref:Rv1733c family protein n=1 Tax=Nocardia brasiliensis TaxID=37326 RepID=UPI0024564488|nr:hypothetical protein [Nocardia brasiliensis]
MSEHTIIPIHASWIRLIRWWSTQPWSPNPLLRASDRCAGAVRLIAALAVLVAVPVAGALGTSAYTESAARIDLERATKHSVSAVLMENPAKTAAYEYQARVQWMDAEHPGTAVVPVPRGRQSGDLVTIWLGADGSPTTEPPEAVAAVLTGIGVGVVVLVGTWLCGWCLVRGTEWVLNRHRNARWADEWRQLSRPISKD